MLRFLAVLSALASASWGMPGAYEEMNYSYTCSTGNDYTIKVGDNLWQIAQDRGTTVEDIMELNPWIRDESYIISYMLLCLPGDSLASTTTTISTYSTPEPSSVLSESVTVSTSSTPCSSVLAESTTVSTYATPEPSSVLSESTTIATPEPSSVLAESVIEKTYATAEPSGTLAEAAGIYYVGGRRARRKCKPKSY